MTITARYPSRCATCGQAIAVGESIEWGKGSPARHTTCPTTTTETTNHTHQPRTSYRPTVCRSCGHVERRDQRGYPIGDRVLRSGECQSCHEERKMGY